jgi:hypothetical protein
MTGCWIYVGAGAGLMGAVFTALTLYLGVMFRREARSMGDPLAKRERVGL